MPHVILQPAGSRHAQRHYRETIETPVALERIRPHVEPAIYSKLGQLYPGGAAWTWGATGGPNNTAEVETMSEGDLLLFYRRYNFYSICEVTLVDMENRSLALELWPPSEQTGEPFEHIYFLTAPEPIDIDFNDMYAVHRQGPSDKLWGLTVLSPRLSEQVIETFDLAPGVRRDPVQDKAAEAAERGLASSQGFAGSAEERQAIDDHAMARAEEYFQAKGFATRDMSSTHPYDWKCVLGDVTMHVEVKGTRSLGEQVTLTRNEVEFARKHADRMVLFIVHSIEVKEKEDGSAEARGGTRKLYQPWDVDAGKLQVINYKYTVPEQA